MKERERKGKKKEKKRMCKGQTKWSQVNHWILLQFKIV
jgi:hypothetical protein